MLNDYTRITILLSRDEFTALREKAISEYRHPRDQARYLLRQTLGLATDDVQSQPMHNRGAMDSDPQHATVAS